MLKNYFNFLVANNFLCSIIKVGQLKSCFWRLAMPSFNTRILNAKVQTPSFRLGGYGYTI